MLSLNYVYFIIFVLVVRDKTSKVVFPGSRGKRVDTLLTY